MSLFLNDLGFDGNKLKDKVYPEATNYVLFSDSHIKILEEEEHVPRPLFLLLLVQLKLLEK